MKLFMNTKHRTVLRYDDDLPALLELGYTLIMVGRTDFQCGGKKHWRKHLKKNSTHSIKNQVREFKNLLKERNDYAGVRGRIYIYPPLKIKLHPQAGDRDRRER